MKLRTAGIGILTLAGLAFMLPSLGHQEGERDDRFVEVVIKVSVANYPTDRGTNPNVSWKVNGVGDFRVLNEGWDFARNLGRHRKGTTVEAYVVPPAEAVTGRHYQGVAIYFDGRKVAGPPILNRTTELGPALTTGPITAQAAATVR
jgi:hypothetical protein